VPAGSSATLRLRPRHDLDGLGDDLAEAGQEVGRLAGMEALGVVAADRQRAG
jgi:hypothetical protein